MSIADSFKQAILEETKAGKPVSGAEGGVDSGALKYVKEVKGKWALVSRKTGRPLKYFKSKPSREEADKALRAVEFFKHEGVESDVSLGDILSEAFKRLSGKR